MDWQFKLVVMTRMFAVLLLFARLPSDRCLDPNAHFSDSDLQCAVGFDREAASSRRPSGDAPQANGRLLRPTSAQKAEWIQRTFPAEVKTGVWIGTKLDANGETLAGIRAMNQRKNCGDLTTLQTLWPMMRTASCSNPRTAVLRSLLARATKNALFVCEQPADRARARTDGRAATCEIQKSEEVAFDRANCAEDELNVRCEEESGTIVVDYALYGTSLRLVVQELKGAACSSNHSPSPTDCIDAGSLLHARQPLSRPQVVQGGADCRPLSVHQLHGRRDGPPPSNEVHEDEGGEPALRARLSSTSAVWALPKAKEKRPYAEAKRECAARGGQLASFSNRTDFVRFLNSKPPSNYEFWIHNTTVGALPLGGPRRAECLAVSSWSSRLSQVPCFAQLGWICEFVPNGRSEARITDVPRNTSRAEKPNSSRGPAKCERREWNGVDVPATAECQTASFECPRGLDGAAVWACECGRAEVGAPTGPLELHESLAERSARDDREKKEEPLNVMRRFQSDLRELFAARSLAGGDIRPSSSNPAKICSRE
ncbi:hypothetical protein M3Y99_00732900 [Aphelenchoides fujianensis]|nr:hypothetical protein M3Y99_00732900 [Aphelenchoides fujianensis]